MPTGIYPHSRLRITYEVNSKGCHLCTSHSLSKAGYPRTQVDKKHYSLHRYIYEQVFGKQPSNIVIRHTCDNPKCININHLIPGTKGDNSSDMVNRNRSAKGEKHGNSKLTERQVNEIKSSSLSTYKLAKIHGVSRQNIGFIKRGETWRHI